MELSSHNLTISNISNPFLIPNTNDQFDSAAYYIMITSIVLSLTSSLMLIFILKDKIYAKSKLMILVTNGELISICSTVWFLLRYNTKINFAKVFYYSGIYRFLYDNSIAKVALDKIGISLFYSFQTFSILMSSFLCLEMFFSLKYPIAQVRKRINIYLIITYSITGVQFILLMINTDFYDIKTDEFITDALFHDNFTGKLIINRIINFICFIFFFASGLLSICYLILRFCKASNANIARDLRNKFVAKHCCFVGVYLTFYLPMMINEFIYIVKQDIKSLLSIEVII